MGSLVYLVHQLRPDDEDIADGVSRVPVNRLELAGTREARTRIVRSLGSVLVSRGSRFRGRIRPHRRIRARSCRASPDLVTQQLARRFSS